MAVRDHGARKRQSRASDLTLSVTHPVSLSTGCHSKAPLAWWLNQWAIIFSVWGWEVQAQKIDRLGFW